MDIAVDPSEVHEGVSYHGNTLVIDVDLWCVCVCVSAHQSTTHIELNKSNILSVVASLTPFSDLN